MSFIIPGASARTLATNSSSLPSVWSFWTSSFPPRCSELKNTWNSGEGFSRGRGGEGGGWERTAQLCVRRLLEPLRRVSIVGGARGVRVGLPERDYVIIRTKHPNARLLPPRLLPS